MSGQQKNYRKSFGTKGGGGQSGAFGMHGAVFACV
jgi:hypothetical protein